MVDFNNNNLDHEYFMEEALKMARKGEELGEVPVGAIVVDPDNTIISIAKNMNIALNDSTAHAEILAIREASSIIKNYRLNGYTLYVTLEPCIMCAGAIIHARFAKLVYGTHDPKSGAFGSLYNFHLDNRLNHKVEVISGILESDSKNLLKEFFQRYRK